MNFSEIRELLEGLSVGHMIIAGGLLAARILSMVWLTPFLGGRLVPNRVKVAVGISLAIILSPMVADPQALERVFHPPIAGTPMALWVMLLLVKEAFIGFVIGYMAGMVWFGVQMMGKFVDTARGANQAEAMVPQLKARASIISNIFYQMFIVIFLVMDGHHIFFAYLFRSYELLPVAEFPPMAGLWPFVQLSARTTAHLFFVALTLGAPAIIAVFITDVCMGLFNRVAPQINVLFLVMPFKAALGLAFILLALSMIVTQGETYMGQALHNLRVAIHYLAAGR